MTTMTISGATDADKQQLMDVLRLAFAGDPFERWLYPEPHGFMRDFPLFLEALTAQAIERQTFYFVDGFAGAAAWLPPGTSLDEDRIAAALGMTISKEKQGDIVALMEQMAHFRPHGPHWYLDIIGVDPSQHGRGIGSILMEYTLAACDDAQVPAYLESTNERNIPFYMRHGFELLGTLQAGRSAPMYPMVRHPHHKTTE